MTYSQFTESLTDNERKFNYYFAEESVPLPLKEDTIVPPILSDYLRFHMTSFWQGIGTVSLPHTDEAENIMCVFKGYKNFTIVSPFHSRFVYAGKGLPDNYSPLNFEKPTLIHFPLFKFAKVYRVQVQAGDCLYLPGNWWH